MDLHFGAVPPLTLAPAPSAADEFDLDDCKLRLESKRSDLAEAHAVVTGGCGALGLELAIMLANSGILSTRDFGNIIFSTFLLRVRWKFEQARES